MRMAKLDDIFDLFDRFGHEEYGESISQRAHALQVAHFARDAGEPDSIVAAALLHDVGQLIGGAGSVAEREKRDARHEIGGATFLKGLFAEDILAPVRLHVAAKRYLCAVDPDYLRSLSQASVLSLELQGGPYTAAEADSFRRLPFAAEATRLRHYDDLGKQVDLAVPPLETYRPLLERLTLVARVKAP